MDIETDYLVVGAGAGGMVFTDALLAHSDATITIVDRRHAPGGHWIDAYPYVRLHQPSTFYGVDSTPIGEDVVDKTGPNAGFYSLAGADELRAYFQHVMDRRFLPSGRVRYFPSCDYVGDHRFVSRLTGDTTHVRVRRKLVDTTYIEGKVPATSPPPFTIEEGMRCIPAGEIVRLDRHERFVIIGGGKTALDACMWLLERGVPADSICWIRPRDAWWMNRKFQQPHELLPDLYRGAAIQIEAMAKATSIDDLFARLESERVLLRIDPTVAPTMFRGALAAERELDLLRTIRDVVRLGHVMHIGRNEIVLEHGSVPTNERNIHVHCAASGLSYPPVRPIFERDRVTLQPIFWGFACYQFATIAVVEASLETEEEKNQLCFPMPYWNVNRDFASAFLATMIGDRARIAHPKLGPWIKSTRLNPASGVAPHKSDPRVVEARERIKQFGIDAAVNLQKLLG